VQPAEFDVTRLCDPSTGVCEIARAPGESVSPADRQGVELIYVGDPMCSWCWGVSPALKEISQYCADRRIRFSLLVGGLRPGGGDPWNESFRSFLRREWETIQQRTGQPFGFQLLGRASYNYDTEPACCAIVAARSILPEGSLATTTLVSFFSSVQKKFYTRGEDPSEAGFYQDICEQHELDYERFRVALSSEEIARATHQEYARVRQLGVRGFPSFLLRSQDRVGFISAGYTTAQQLKNAVSRA
jgi:putative protein-disulfide isomerase